MADKSNDTFDDEIKKILERDPLNEVENGLHRLPDEILDNRPEPKPGELDDQDTFKTKVSFEETLGHAVRVNALKNAAMELTGDSTLSSKLQKYLDIAEEIGFKTVLEVPFTVEQSFDEKPRQEKLFVLWREDGILLTFDTFEGNVNGGHFYYNWSFKDEADRRGVTSSGEWIDNNTWAGNHDCREGLKFHIRQLEKNGKFMPKWVKRPFLWLLHHGDTANDVQYDYEKINNERIALLPAEVREAITPRTTH